MMYCVNVAPNAHIIAQILQFSILLDDPDQVTPMNDPAAEACNQLHTFAYVVLFVKRGACYDFRTI